MNRHLGINWNPATDKLSVTVKVNVSKKNRGKKTEPDLTYEEIPKILKMKFTRRLVLRIVNSCYDPLGLVSVILVQLKIEMRKLYDKERNIGWDDDLPVEMKERWVELF